MKAFYLVGSILFTVLILVMSFGNIGATCSELYFLFFRVNENPTIITMTVAVVGVITGAMYHAFFSRVMATTDDDEDL
jgi:uncharacterized integral membrane protein